MRTRTLGLMLLAALCASACDDGPLPLANEDMQVVVTERYRACTEDSDCTLADISCNGCCERDAVTTDLVDAFERDRAETCAGYRGPVCDCVVLPLEARCREDRCVTVPGEEDRANE